MIGSAIRPPALALVEGALPAVRAGSGKLNSGISGCRLAVWREIPDRVISETYLSTIPLHLAVNVRCGHLLALKVRFLAPNVPVIRARNRKPFNFPERDDVALRTNALWAFNLRLRTCSVSS
ncbi:hypothetical protein MPC1_4480003 [Methylocella tundrae]|nr:hypothetical protein MPC1_4480003 [Methylocella tundrae]